MSLHKGSLQRVSVGKSESDPVGPNSMCGVLEHSVGYQALEGGGERDEWGDHTMETDHSQKGGRSYCVPQQSSMTTDNYGHTSQKTRGMEFYCFHHKEMINVGEHK